MEIKAEIQSILATGQYLGPFGMNEWAFSRVVALQVIEALCAIKVPILGGDIYRVMNGRPCATGDSWFCSSRASESLDAFIVRSCNESMKYLEEYDITYSDDTLIVIVPGH